jgi:ESS family glutamate:Na+ symporter
LEFTVVEGLRTLKLDLVLTLALAALFLFAGGWLQRRVGVFARASIPSAAIGGLLFAGLVMLLRRYAPLGVGIDSTLRAPLQTAFFTTIGYGATLGLLRAGGARMIFFFMIASVMAVVQNFAGIALALALKAPPALGIICGSLTLTGGPATGLAFAGLFEQKGVAGAGALIIASATFGIFVSSLVGNPVATALIRRRRLAPEIAGREDDATEPFWAIGSMSPPDEETPETDAAVRAKDEARATEPSELLRNLLLILLAMGVGALISLAATRGGITLPGYVGTMLVAGIARNLDDRYGWLRIDARAMDALGTIALALFLVIALMDLKLWQLAGLAVPMLVILSAQVLLMILYAVFVTFVLMGRDYEAAVTASGHVGFGLGITPNAVANMEALAARYGPAPRSFLVVPVVGAFFIDFTNAVVITAFANWIK